MAFSILVNTCDKFEDCWDPFFKLFAKYWPNNVGTIYLNTEYKDYSYPGLNIVCVKGCSRNGFPRDKRATWSQCLKWALDIIETDVVLYLQEDYFLNAQVDNEAFIYYLNLISQTDSMHCLHISIGAGGSDGPSRYNNIDIMKRHYRYRVGCQAALWKKSILSSYIDIKESAWDFEEFASKRGAYTPHNFYLVNQSYLESHPVLPYLMTGIIQGRWWEPVVELFDKEGIVIDYKKRGFVGKGFQKPFWKRVDYRIHKIPRLISHAFKLLKLKYDNRDALKKVDRP